MKKPQVKSARDLKLVKQTVKKLTVKTNIRAGKGEERSK